jgi:hypothetical protein
VWEESINGGRAVLELPDGGYQLTFIDGSRHVPRRLELAVDSPETLTVILRRATVLLAQDFDGPDVTYAFDNRMTNSSDSIERWLDHWSLTPLVYHSPPRSLTDSERGSMFNFDDNWCAPYNLLDRHWDLSTAETAALVFYLNQALEPGYDSLRLELSAGGPANSDPGSWLWVAAGPAHQDLSILTNVPEMAWNSPRMNYQKFGAWKRFVVPLDSWCGEPVVHFRFHLKSDSSVTQDGVYMDDLMLLRSGEAPAEMGSNSPLLAHLQLGLPHPNPFNGPMQVAVNMPAAGPAKVALYDILGRLVLDIYDGRLAEGETPLAFDGSGLAAGIYLLRVKSGGQTAIQKITLMK